MIATLVVAALAAVLATAQAVPYGPGMGANWAQPTIAGLKDTAAYDSHQTLYGTFDEASGRWTGLHMSSTNSTAGSSNATTTSAAEMLRNSNAEGWDVLKFRSLEARDEFYAVGYLEGLATYESISNYWYNVIRKKEALLTAYERKFIATLVNGTRSLPPTSAFNRQALSVMRQIDGMYDGWKAANTAAGSPAWLQNVTWDSVFLISMLVELTAIGDSEPEIGVRSSRPTHCHGAMRVHGSELLIGHAAQDDYTNLLRQWKTYEFSEGRNVTMSSYPGFVHSSDDFMVNGHGVFMMSTSLLNYNTSNMEALRPTGVPGFVQLLVATYLAATPQEYADTWTKDNNGALMNQAMIVDVRRAQAALDAGMPLPPHTFVMCENYPTVYECGDMTWWLNSGRAWISFDVAYFNKTRDAGGSDTKQALHSEMGFCAWPSSAVAPLERDMEYVTDVASMFYAMRHNNYPHDPLLIIPGCNQSESRWVQFNCSNDPTIYTSPMLTFGARQDLGPEDYDFGPAGNDQFRAKAFGSIDGKVTSARMLADPANMTVILQNGPTSVQHPPFSFSEFYATHPTLNDTTSRHRGISDRVDFSPVVVRPLSGLSNQQRAGAPDGGSVAAGVAVAVVVVALAAAVGAFVVVRQRQAQRRTLSASEATGLL